MANVEVGRAPERDGKIKLHGPEAYAGMRKAGQLAAEALDMLHQHVKPGVTTETLDDLVFDFAARPTAPIPAPLNYRGFPSRSALRSTTSSATAFPGAKPLREGDIVNIDVTLIVDGWHGDTSRMFAVGDISRRAERLIRVTYEALHARHRGREARRHHRAHRRRHPVLSPKPSAAASCAISAGTALARSSTTAPTSCTTARPAKACRA